MQLASCASSSWRWPALLERDMILPVALHTAAQSRLSRMQATRCETSRSDRQASAQAVQVSTQLKHASMQRLMVSEWAGFSGCERNMARTATADMQQHCLFRPPQQNPAPRYWFLSRRFLHGKWRSHTEPCDEFHAIRCPQKQKPGASAGLHSVD